MNNSVTRRATLLMAVLLTLVLPRSHRSSVESQNKHLDSKTVGCGQPEFLYQFE